MTTLGSSVQPVGNLLHTHDLYDHLRAVPPAIAPHADPLNFCSPRIADPRIPREVRHASTTPVEVWTRSMTLASRNVKSN